MGHEPPSRRRVANRKWTGATRELSQPDRSTVLPARGIWDEGCSALDVLNRVRKRSFTCDSAALVVVHRFFALARAHRFHFRSVCWIFSRVTASTEFWDPGDVVRDDLQPASVRTACDASPLRVPEAFGDCETAVVDGGRSRRPAVRTSTLL